MARRIREELVEQVVDVVIMTLARAKAMSMTTDELLLIQARINHFINSRLLAEEMLSMLDRIPHEPDGETH